MKPPATDGRQRGSFLWFGVALVLVGLGALLLGGAEATGPRIQVSNVANPVDDSARDLLDIRANNSPRLASDPRDARRVALANRIDTPSFGCALHHSGDGGLSWSAVDIPLPDGEEPKCFAPDVAYDAAGTLFVSFVTLATDANSPNAVWLVSSTDGGASLSKPTRVLGRLAFQTDLTADPDVPGRLYLAWLQASELGSRAFATTGNPINLVSSHDGGATWTEAVGLSGPERIRALAPSLVAGPGGRLFVSYLDLGEDVLDYGGAHEGRGGDPYVGDWRLVMARSDDGGRTWSETETEAHLVPTERFIAFNPPPPALAVDGDRVYVAYPDGRDGNVDVWLWVSEDAGVTWALPRKPGGDGATDSGTQTRPAVAVAESGRVDIVYYDRAGDPQDRLTNVTFASSFDGGRKFTAGLALSERSFDSTIGAGSENGLPDLGSRLGLLSGPDGALAVWTDTRAGTQASNKQDLARALVAISTDSNNRSMLLRGGGLAVVAVGIGLIGWIATGGARGRRRSLKPEWRPEA